MTQQEFLKDAMARLGLSKRELAARLGTTENRMEAFLAPADASSYCDLDESVWRLVREIVSSEQIPSK